MRSTNSVASVNATEVVRVDARNSVGNVTAFGAVGTIQVIRAPSIAGVAAQNTIRDIIVQNWNAGNPAQDFASTISSAAGNINTVNVQGARMRGTVTADQGAMTNGVFSSVGIGPTSGTPSVIRAKSGISSIDAPTIVADVNTRYNGGAGGIMTLRASTGDFSGSLQAAAIGGGGNGFSVAGNLSASVSVSGNVDRSFTVTGATTGQVTLGGTVSQPVALNGGVSSGGITLGTLTSSLTIAGSPSVDISIGSVSSTGSVSIGGAFAAGRLLSIAGNFAGSINLPTSGLAGQILVNTADSGGDWISATGRVRLGPGGSQYTLAHADYGIASSSLGGGSVGVVRYLLNRADCPLGPGNSESSPELIRTNINLSTTEQASEITFSALRLAWYGPVQAGPGTSQLSIEYYGRTSPTAFGWMPVEAAFDVIVNPAGPASARSVSIAPLSNTHWNLGKYRVSRASANGLRCAGTTAATPPDIADFGYYY